MSSLASVHPSKSSPSPKIEEKSTGSSAKVKLLPSLRKITSAGVEKVLANWGSFSPFPSLKEAFANCSSVKVSTVDEPDCLETNLSASRSISTTETSGSSTCWPEEVLCWPHRNEAFSFQLFSWRRASSDEINFCLFLYHYGPVFAVALALKLGWKIERQLRELLATVEGGDCIAIPVRLQR
jgi:hypothetical protein